MHTFFTGMFNLSTVYNLPLTISKTGFENVNFGTIEVPTIDGKKATELKGDNQL